jgi:curved DNA binding protein
MEGDEHTMDDYEATFLDQPAILDKVKAAGVISDEALKLAISKCVPDADIHTICQEVDKFMQEELKKVFSNKKSKNFERGIAMPCCISVNEICGNYSPMADESDKLKEGDVAKIDLGCHIHGFAAQAAHTIVVSADKGSKVDGRKADVILAAHEAMRAAVRAIKPQASNYDVTDAIAAVCADYECSPLEGVLSHSMKKHMCDGNEVILNKETPENKVKEFQFEPGQVFSLDIFVSTGEG